MPSLENGTLISQNRLTRLRGELRHSCILPNLTVRQVRLVLGFRAASGGSLQVLLRGESFSQEWRCASRSAANPPARLDRRYPLRLPQPARWSLPRPLATTSSENST